MNLKAVRALLVGIALVVGALAFTKPVHSVTYPRAAVVLVENSGGYGSAVVLQKGLLLSADHIAVAHEFESLTTRDGRGLSLVARSNNEDGVDLSAFSADVDCPCAEIAQREAQMDEALIVVGYPRGLVSTVSHGESQGVLHVKFRGQSLGRRLVVSAQVAPGSSGGGVFAWRDGRWVLVGVVVEGNETTTFAIPVADIRAFLKMGAS